MATKYFCDRCKNEVTKEKGSLRIIKLFNEHGNTKLEKEICLQCSGFFERDFMNPPVSVDR